ncbi:hypothetical protein [Allosphingosinicella sp.]|jgi:hypothetical protein|uniref:hypothetical protein n=1 Tax=Allosphingosinicella sp. TaxID=2823234 RepID=UPI002F0523D8
MTKTFPILALAAAAALAGCADRSEPQQFADAETVIAAAGAASEPAAALEENGLVEKLQKAERLSGTVEKIQPEKIDPNLIAGLVAR